MKNFGEFYNDQVEHAGCIVLSRTDGVAMDKLEACVALLREHNPTATIITTPWSQLEGAQILAAMEKTATLDAALADLAEEEPCPVCGHHHEHDHHHHDHHHHDGDGHCHEHHHDHHHHHGEECDCHEHHHHHHADEVFDSYGVETPATFTAAAIREALEQLGDTARFGTVLRAKGIVAGKDGEWVHFDYVPDAPDVRAGGADVIGRLCVIGSGLNKPAIAALFGLPYTEGC